MEKKKVGKVERDWKLLSKSTSFRKTLPLILVSIMEHGNDDCRSLNNNLKDKPSWIIDLETKGYAIVPNVISEKANQYYDRFWDWIEAFGPGIKRNKKNTWNSNNWPESRHGIIQHYALGHEQFIWDLRMEESVINVFAILWGTRNLLVSFDGANLSRRDLLIVNIAKVHQEVKRGLGNMLIKDPTRKDSIAFKAL